MKSNRIPYVAGNWKMYKTVAEARHLVSELVPGLQAISSVEKVLCPPSTTLMAVKELLEGTDIGLGAQNLYWETFGAYTGELAPAMIAELCEYVIIGHSERRAYFHEADETVNLKVKAALKHGIKPIVCIGETFDENESGQTGGVITRQIKSGMVGIDFHESLGGVSNNIVSVPLVVAYEPVWAIGTGKAATAEGANQIIADYIRPALADLYGEKISQNIRVLYGGSVKANNAREFFEQSEIDGALVGGASLKVEEFVPIVESACNK